MNHEILFNRTTVRGWELRKGCESFAHHVCAALNLRKVTVKWAAEITTACIDNHGTMMLASVRDDAVITRAMMLRYSGFVVHELLHRKYTEMGTFHPSGYLFHLQNALEDARIEHAGIDSALLGNIENLLTALMDQMVAEAVKAVSDWADPRQYPFLLALHARRHGPKIKPPANLVPIFDEAARRVLLCSDTADTFNLAQWVYDQIMNLPKEKAGNDAKGSNGKKSKKAPKNPSDQPESGDQEQGKGEVTPAGKNGSEKPDSDAMATAPSGDCYPVCVEPTLAPPDGVRSCGTYTAGASTAEPSEHQQRIEAYAPGKPVPARLRYEVRKLFERTAMTEFSPNRKSGSINTRALHKFGVSDALFQMRRDHDGIDSAVVLVIDISQSMFDYPERIEAATQTAHALLDTLSAAGVNTCVLTFGSRIAVHGGFTARLPEKHSSVSRIRSGGNTNDYAAVKIAHDLLQVRPEARRVCFVLTDGEGNPPATKEQVASGLTLGITTIGIGICKDVSRVYPNSVLVKNPEDLGTVAFNHVKVAA